MRLFYFLLLLSFPSIVYSQVCDETAFEILVSGTVICDSLTVDAAIPLSGSGGFPIEIDVTGDVVIGANITLDGIAGDPFSTDNHAGPLGGPGAGNGGGVFVGFTENGTDGSIATDGTTANGKTPAAEACANGGGGGGFLGIGADGLPCGSTVNPVGAGGGVAPVGEFDFAGPFRGGYGGGAGGLLVAPFDVGTGGGGGGGLHIHAGGTITILSGVTISARGGNGGNSINLGGAGGGGSGGIIWLEADLGIINNGTLDVTAGSGGTNTFTPAPGGDKGGDGGDGGVGIIRLNSAGTITNNSSVISPSSSASSRPSLESDITCGTVASPAQKENTSTQLMMGFMLALFSGWLIKILSRSRKLVLMKSVYRN